MNSLGGEFRDIKEIGNGVGIVIDPNSFRFSTESETQKFLEGVSEETGRTIIGINGIGHSSVIKILDGDETSGLLKEGIDGVISHNKNTIEIILGVADCAAIAFSSTNGKTIGLIHAGWKGVSGGIIGKLLDTLPMYGDLKSDFKFYLSPMIGNNYEFSEDDFTTYFRKFSEYRLKIDDYFLKSGIEGKGYLQLRQLILDIFEKHGVGREKIEVSPVSTTTPGDIYPSYRLHTLYNRIIEKIQHFIGDMMSISIEDILNQIKLDSKHKQSYLIGLRLTREEKELFMSDNFLNYSENNRLRVHIIKK